RRGRPPPTRRNTSLAPSKSCTFAGSTATAQTSPSVSTRMCRLRPLISFPRVEPLGPAGLGGLDALAVDDGPPGGVLLAPQPSEADAEDGVDLLEDALIPPGVEVVTDELPGRGVVRQHPPGTAAAGQVAHGVDDLPPGVGAAASGLAFGPPLRREQVLDVVPLDVGQITGVSLWCPYIQRRGHPKYRGGLFSRRPWRGTAARARMASSWIASRAATCSSSRDPGLSPRQATAKYRVRSVSRGEPYSGATAFPPAS